ncbi:RagB/SusD family nutrient uptake outer membrane protein [Myroides sp. M-43]|uniref:RagB/SusD family nutrient uptake outer membrane protein n=1 Tax=Myroides oncorhynchi TaxID=2893756 RepID=UPI001E4E4CB3|nr:RagB/SusD family nutrient uptake outer membrane protein [Myroides oncorhynchi]MCC9041962.1 RagB/SusD family nutrient uptake outer membrane protein [Myroides oncorhynchi]
MNNSISHKKLFTYSILLLLINFILISCDQLVDVDLPDNKVNQQDVFKNVSSVKSALSQLYTNVRDKNFITKNTNGVSHGLSLYTDELNYVGTSTSNFYINSIQPNSPETANWWNSAYQNIYQINAFIEGLTQSQYIEQKLKEPFLGEAYTLRALHYHYLIQLYGDIPYTLTTDYKFNTNINKTPYNQVLLEIEKNLLIAHQYLTYEYRSANKFHINKAIVELLLAENYLLQKRFDLAQQYCQNILDNKLYQIESDLNNTFKKTSKSTLWQLSPHLETNITPEANAYIFTALSANTTAISTELINKFDPEDLRLKNWIKSTTVNNTKFLTAFKYKNKTNNTDEYSIFYRIEHVYFIYIESLFFQNKRLQAITELNKIRQVRGVKPIDTALSSDEFEQVFLDESQREFFTEIGQRFFTLKRFEKLNQLKSTKTNWLDYHQLFPIPEKQLLINKNLNPNNHGY